MKDIIYWIVEYILFAVGARRIISLCDGKKNLAFVPCLRYFELGDISGRDEEGRMAGVLEGLMIVALILDEILDFASLGGQISFVFSVAALALGLALTIYGLRVGAGLCRTFSVSRWWLFLWIFAPWLCMLIWGYGSQYEPVNLGIDDENAKIAGFVPAKIGTIAEPVKPEESGLFVNVRKKTVRSLLKQRYLLSNIVFSVPNDTLVMLLGGSGCGKTTLINAITGYEKADATILLNGADLYKDYDRLKYKVGMVPQQELMRMNDTVISTLNDASLLRLPVEVEREERLKRIEGVLDTLGLAGGKHGMISKKSGGQKKRISIGMELISDPELFILDEPDSGLDGVIARELFEKLREIAHDNKIVIAITHTPDRVIHLFDKVIVLARDSNRVGRLAFYGTPQEARDFFGKKTMEQIVMSVNRKEEGGEGRADEFIEKYASMVAAKGGSAGGVDND